MVLIYLVPNGHIWRNWQVKCRFVLVTKRHKKGNLITIPQRYDEIITIISECIYS